MKGSVYAVLFTNGLFKVGHSKNVASRVRTHISAGKSFGYESEMIFFTEPHDFPQRTEKKLLEFCSDRFNKNSPEYFEGGDYHSVREVMLQTKRMIAWGSGLSVKGDILMVPMMAGGDPDGEYVKIQEMLIALKKKVIDVIEKNPGVSAGVIKNRMRKHDVSEILEEIEEEGLVTVETNKHPTNGKTISRYTKTL